MIEGCPHSKSKASVGYLFLIIVGCATGCSGPQNPLNPAGLQAARISNLWWAYFWVTLFVYCIVIFFVLFAIVRVSFRKESGAENQSEIVIPSAKRENRLTVAVGTAVGFTVLLLFLLFFADLFTGKSIHSLHIADPITIKINGHLWWWEAVYETAIPSNRVTTAYEIHIPVGKPVQFKLESQNVIHSFWVPNLQGKKDLIPGHPTTIWIRADKPGIFKGQCAEFCGHQHAHMKFIVVAEPEADFDKWLAHQNSNAQIPSTQGEIDGQKLFLKGTCVMCHTVQGTIANGKVGPNLTHIASRKMLASGRAPLNRGYLSGWILDPQHLKPGVKMPQHTLQPEELNALVDYLLSLK
jgi:cytochrome c oxidase subunit 2